MGIAKLYGQKASGASINGIIKDYYVYAGENISTGDLVEYINGKSGQTTTQTSSVVQGPDIYELSATKLDENRVFMAYTNGTGSSSYLYGLVCTISGTTITIGTGTQLSSVDRTGYAMSAVTLDSNRVFIAHSYGSDYYLYGMVCTIDGTTIIPETDTPLVESKSANLTPSAVKLEDNKVFITRYSNTSYYYLYGLVVTINGTTVSKGTNTSISSLTYSGMFKSIVTLNNDKVFIAYSNSSSYYLYGIVCTISGTTISKGTDTQLDSNKYSGQIMSAALLTNGAVFVAYNCTTAYYYLYGVVCTISGTTITAGTGTKLGNKNTGSSVSAIALPDGSVFICHTNTGLFGMVCTVSGTSITKKSDVQLNSLTSFYLDSCLIEGNIFTSFFNPNGGVVHAQIFGVTNNTPTNQAIIPVYETQVRKTTTSQFDGVAKTSGTGGTATAHNEQVSIYTL